VDEQLNPEVLDSSTLHTMREDWDQRARTNAKHYVQSAKEDWDEREFLRSGEISVANEIMPDMVRICGGSRSPRDLSMIEIGCGVGRMTRFIAQIFGSVTAVDVSAEMLSRAGETLRDFPNVTLVHSDGATLASVPDNSQDFAFSFLVFQHVPTASVVESYCREAYRVLRPGALFKLQVQGAVWERERQPDTWEGVSFSEEDARRLCSNSGFQWERSDGANTQSYWLWFKRP
jgi:ubiquinone/menaquinone biosynthesis C-methylase UbiE